jgi:trafficking protein particle complex subunit 2
MIVGRDEPLYELDMARGAAGGGISSPMAGDVSSSGLMKPSHFILHSSLDMVDAAVWSNPATFLKTVDRHNELLVSAYTTAGGARFLLLHDGGRNEDGIRGFFVEVHDLYTKVLLNPFYAPHSRIESRDFDARVRALAKRYLGYKEI